MNAWQWQPFSADPCIYPYSLAKHHIHASAEYSVRATACFGHLDILGTQHETTAQLEQKTPP
jgi:hypothetical protein